MNKKSQTGAVEIAALFVLALALGGFLLLLTSVDISHKTVDKIISAKNQNSAELFLLNTLKTQVEADINSDGINEEFTIADLIAYSENNNEVELALTPILESHLNLFYEKWILTIEYPLRTIKLNKEDPKKYSSTIEIPSLSSQNIKITLKYEEEQFLQIPKDPEVLYKL